MTAAAAAGQRWWRAGCGRRAWRARAAAETLRGERSSWNPVHGRLPASAPFKWSANRALRGGVVCASIGRAWSRRSAGDLSCAAGLPHKDLPGMGAALERAGARGAGTVWVCKRLGDWRAPRGAGRCSRGWCQRWRNAAGFWGTSP